MSQEFSLDALMAFLDYLGKKGLMNRNTVVSRKAACNKVLSVLDENELQDLRTLDLDLVAQRFHNLQGSEYAPKSLRVYKSRVNSTLADFLRYRENPANFSVSAKPRKRTVKPTSESAVRGDNAEAAAPRTASSSLEDERRVQTINVPIALASGCIVQINGIPVDMAPADARRIANVVMAMASEE